MLTEKRLLMITATQQLMEQTTSSRPFLKWAGGKTQLLDELLSVTPDTFQKYIEPFLGGGALFFALSQRDSVLSDSNEELIVTYSVVRDNVDSVIARLQDFSNDERFFYDVRSWDTSKLSDIDRAARLIFLNKTCFKGLYRVNKKGQFNISHYGSSEN